jgi:DNA-binding transcriptional ArsR family regulator
VPQTDPEPPVGRADHVVLSDPRAMRALAHPARLAAIDELYQGNVRTASELAETTGLTPSAMSYHLRALEKWGIVLRAEPAGDGRERPWRAAGRGLRWTGHEAGPVVMDTIAGEYLAGIRSDLDAWQRYEPQASPQWRDTSGISRGFPWLTAEEARELTDKVAALIGEYAGRTAEAHPPQARRVTYFFALAPQVDGFDGGSGG